ncbi:MAG: N-formylglutamate amidohydrolase [Gammaproteobacteria bacterium]|nr:N-formylglutamate amidohydrolase [Gammaproteobacteria bacterium]MDH4254780.1 N-formylglutamate amidohydrolase [Gammaproteobacteria bacterium]MDH5309891.1 N-formylglutamate amidohydrolase [Gammaproteobacteria bacterium]
MPVEGTPVGDDKPRLLNPDEPVPFRVLNPDATTPLLLVCDHASRRFPASLGTLGLDPPARRCHLAWDIGAGALTRRLAKSMGVTAVLAEYSRLVVDCNRDLLDPGAFLEFGDGVVIPGNRKLRQAQKDLRAAELYWPYHYAIDIEVKRLAQHDYPPAFATVHSFTPVLDGVSRPWQVGVLWDADRDTAEILIDGFRTAGFLVGDNEPYSGKAPQDFTIDHHAEDAGLPHVGIEIRQDLIADAEGVNRIAAIMEPILRRIPAGRRLGGPVRERSA